MTSLSELRKKWQQYQPLLGEPLAMLLLVLILSIVFFVVQGARRASLNPQVGTATIADYTKNVLLVQDTRFDTQDYKYVEVRFNQPIDIHHLQHNATITPEIPGKWELVDGSESLVHYTFDQPYQGGYVNLHLAEGLLSANNKVLRSDFDRFFSVRQTSDQQGRVRSYVAGKPIPFFHPPEKVSLYKSNAHTLLSYLQYELPNEMTRGDQYNGQFTEYKVEHRDQDKVSNPKINVSTGTIELDPGVYFVEHSDENGYFIVVSTFGVLLRQDDQQVVVSAFDFATNKSLNDQLTIGLYNLKEGVHLLRDFVYTKETASQPVAYESKLDAVIAIYKDEIAFVPVEVLSSNADINVYQNLDQVSRFFVYTDRPIYKPGDTVFIRGVVRQDADSLYELPKAGSPVYIQVDGNPNDPIKQTVALDDAGVFYTHVVLPKDYQSEYVSIQASLKPYGPGVYGYTGARFEVAPYTKPDFEIKANITQPEHLLSDKLKFTVSANYFDGSPVKDKKLSYELYTMNYYEVEKAVYNKNFNIRSPGGMCGGGSIEDYYGDEYDSGSVTLDSNGRAEIVVSADDETVFGQTITLLAKTKDGNGNELVSAATTIVHAADSTVFFMPSADTYSPGQQVVAPFYAEKLDGSKLSNTHFEYSLLEYNYQDTQGFDSENEPPALVQGTVQTDGSGKGIIIFTLPKDIVSDQKILVIQGKDAAGNKVQNSKQLDIQTPEQLADLAKNPWWVNRSAQTFLKMTANQSSFKVGDTVRLDIESPAEFDALLSFERGRVYQPRIIHLTKGHNQLEFEITEELSPSITVVLSFFVDGEYRTEGLSLNVPAMHKLLNISVTPNKQVYTPNETAELVVTTTDSTGAPVPAQLSLGVVDKAIFALRKSATPPMHSSFYYFRPRATNASSSLTGMGQGGDGRGGGGGGGSGLGNAVDVLYWDPILRTDGTGRKVVQVPLLGYETIWKVQVYGSTRETQVGQADAEFTVTDK